MPLGARERIFLPRHLHPTRTVTARRCSAGPDLAYPRQFFRAQRTRGARCAAGAPGGGGPEFVCVA